MSYYLIWFSMVQAFIRTMHDGAAVESSEQICPERMLQLEDPDANIVITI